MSTDIAAPKSDVSLNIYLPFVVKSCVLSNPLPLPEPNPQDEIFVPVPPSVTPSDLPELETGTQIIDTSPDEIIGCTNILISGGEQDILNEFFPGAAEGDGVINRFNNDIWVYRNLVWQNVGPTPGPQVVVVTVLPPWNEIVKLTGKTKTKISINSLAYALQLLTEFSVKIKTKLLVKGARELRIGAASSISISTDLPTVIGGAPRTAILFSVETGTQSPILGDIQVSPTSNATDLGWSFIYESTADELSTQVGNFQFYLTLNSVKYQNCYVNSNFYITFGGSQNQYQNLGAAVPSLPKLHLGSGDFSYQRIYTKSTEYSFHIRIEGNSYFGAPPGSSNSFVEVSFYHQADNGSQYIEVRSGDIGYNTTGPFMLATASTALASTSFASNQSWVFVGNDTGTSWIVQSGKYLTIDISKNIILQNSSILTLNAEFAQIDAINEKTIFADVSNINIASNPPVVYHDIAIHPNTINYSLASLVPNVDLGASIFCHKIEFFVSKNNINISTGCAILSPVTHVIISSQQALASSGNAIKPSEIDIAIIANIPSAIGYQIQSPISNINIDANIPNITTSVSISCPSYTISITATPLTISIGASAIAATTNVSIGAIQDIAISAIAGNYFSGIANQDYSYEEDWHVDSFAG